MEVDTGHLELSRCRKAGNLPVIGKRRRIETTRGNPQDSSHPENSGRSLCVTDDKRIVLGKKT